MQIKSGARLRSQADSTELVVVRPIPGEVELTCGGHPMVDIKAEPQPGLAVLDGATGGTQQGKRYTLAGTGLEILVTKAGTGALAIGARPLVLKEARPLPASD
ncbi:hypothetical protein I6A84_22430 [Frankia sp. CNm7]|uniref:Uncharacterized protein n=1 Tax=Frankia nepalensis TaxID=1836974 RepID=A0A937R7L8_9ACTN|nr:hypothetical protein [Frankia nepalensis]MBL7500004.1 hypothetical protein [Frankia nepalensis]MBL7510650.1 hypothetical protein [Frankia nepalensis]MBL7520769.1 hypothetical protein [Frankia nepalensis]MBL7627183.1 hypothetical protein [Frankia nepalensis]